VTEHIVIIIIVFIVLSRQS